MGTFSLAVTAVVLAGLQLVAPAQEALELIIRRQIDERLRAQTLDDLMRPAQIAHLEDPGLRDHLPLIRHGGANMGASPGGAAVMTVRLLAVYVQGLGGAVLVGLAFSWWGAAGLLSVCLLSRRIVRRAFLAFLRAWVDPEQLRGQRRFGYTMMLGVGLAGAKESRVFGLAGWLVDRFLRDWQLGLQRTEQTRNGLFRAFGRSYGLLLISYALVFLAIAWAASSGRLELGALAVAVQASFDLAPVSDGSLGLGAGVRDHRVAESECAVGPRRTRRGEREGHALGRDGSGRRRPLRWGWLSLPGHRP
jgi:ATP-binding cassette, subfamily B, bacterial